ncbi:SDR family NAD(P)-dependent oxidoreductase [Microbacterium rhizomatis]|uniref:SDR family oxidoreductase n=1 Tax=Microbacterium rhizomatis TaxID=1631477 RepID=A0A5J5J169_9MICO|nr:SDR family NAD(P)-dependent oxidoreductase [Microbacterium rhizomatis]KAA9108215.1 SDR family oxidoreductase [Microbacterium rhizomatis]
MTSSRLSGRVAYVLGGGSDGPARAGETLAIGNGRAIALRLSAEGATVIVGDKVLERAAATVEHLSGPGLAVQVDAADPASCRHAVAAAAAHAGRLDIVVCNVGISGREPLKVQTLEDWGLADDVNVRSHWITAQAALPGMLDAGSGAFVFVGSTAGILSSRRSLSYEATKAAQLAVMRHIAVRYAERGVRSNAVVLGNIDSALVRREFGADGSAARARVVPMGREGTPEEAASAVAFLASDDAGYITGQSLIVDGGVSAAWPIPPR